MSGNYFAGGLGPASAGSTGGGGTGTVTVVTATAPVQVTGGATTTPNVSLVAGTRGDILRYNGSAWVDLPVGTNGQVLKSNGTDPGWAADSTGTGTVTNVTATGPIQISGTSTVTPNVLIQAGSASGDILQWNGSAWAIQAISLPALDTPFIFNTTAGLTNIVAKRGANNSPVNNTKVGIFNAGSDTSLTSFGVTGNYATVGGGDKNEALADYACVTGGLFNTAGGLYSVSCGGQTNGAGGAHSVTLGGQHNSSLGDFSCSGGKDSTVNSAGFAYGDTCIIEANSNYSVAMGIELDIAGETSAGFGRNNSTGDGYSFVSGVGNNTHGEESFIGGGSDCETLSSGAIIGSTQCTVFSALGFIAGSNASNANSAKSCIIGGDTNTTDGDEAFVAGGDNGNAAGFASGVLGGTNCTSSGDYSLSGGIECQSLDSNTFTFGNASSSEAEGAITLGNLCTNAGVYSLLGGQDGTINGDVDYSICWGNGNRVSGSSVACFGQNVEVDGIGGFGAGQDSTASADYAVVFGVACQSSDTGAFTHGSNCIAEAAWTYAGGFNCHSSGQAGHSEGTSCVASGTSSHAQNLSCVADGGASDASGNNSFAKRETQRSFASGTQSAAGDNQHSDLVFRGATPGIEPNEQILLQYGQDNDQIFLAENNKAYTFVVEAIATSTDGDYWGFVQYYFARCDAGVLTITVGTSWPGGSLDLGTLMLGTDGANQLEPLFQTGSVAKACSISANVRFTEVKKVKA